MKRRAKRRWKRCLSFVRCPSCLCISENLTASILLSPAYGHGPQVQVEEAAAAASKDEHGYTAAYLCFAGWAERTPERRESRCSSQSQGPGGGATVQVHRVEDVSFMAGRYSKDDDQDYDHRDHVWPPPVFHDNVREALGARRCYCTKHSRVGNM